MKRYKSGLVFGKFLPCTKGHLYLINTALQNSEKVSVVVCSVKDEPIPGDLRYEWVSEIYKDNDRVSVYHCNEELPQYPTEDKVSFWCLWADTLKKYAGDDIDCLFTSEDYGEPFSKHLMCSHYLVDIDRKSYPVSGTAVRNDPFGNWSNIPDIVKPYFIKRVAIVGPESVGKSVLIKKVARYFNTNFVPEYARYVYENSGNKLKVEDFEKIYEGRQQIENQFIKSSNKLILTDTEDICCQIYAQLYIPEKYHLIHDKLEDKIKSGRKYDLYILLNPKGVLAIQDGTRNFLEEREIHYEMIKEELIKRECNFVEIGGNYDDRTRLSKAVIRNMFKI